MAGRHQPRGGGIVMGAALALPGEKIMGNAEPGHVGEDGRFIFGLRAFAIGIVDPEQEFAAVLFREQRIQHGGAGIADMQKPGGRWREADEAGHGTN